MLFATASTALATPLCIPSCAWRMLWVVSDPDKPWQPPNVDWWSLQTCRMLIISILQVCKNHKSKKTRVSVICIPAALQQVHIFSLFLVFSKGGFSDIPGIQFMKALEHKNKPRSCAFSSATYTLGWCVLKLKMVSWMALTAPWIPELGVSGSCWTFCICSRGLIDPANHFCFGSFNLQCHSDCSLEWEWGVGVATISRSNLISTIISTSNLRMFPKVNLPFWLSEWKKTLQPKCKWRDKTCENLPPHYWL